MNQQFFEELTIEPERYELLDDPAFAVELDRRDFFRLVGGGLVVALLLPDALAAQQPGRRGFGAGPQDIGAWLHIGEDSGITVSTGKVEIGQNVRTSLTQVIAEELRVPVGRIRMVMADTQLTPYDAGTFGSGTTPRMASQLRRVAAATHELLLDMAAEQGKLDRKKLIIEAGKVLDPVARQTFEFGQLTRGKKLAKVIGPDVAVTPAEQWRVEGTSVPKVDGRALVTGAHKYASDMARPGMLHGKVLRPPAYQAKLVSVQTDAARAVPGVTVVHEGDFVAVAAPTDQAAAAALALIRADWQTPPQPSSSELFQYLKDHPAAGRGGFGGRGRGGPRGSIEAGMKASDKKLEATYTIAYIAHFPLETRSAMAEWVEDKLTVWTCTQRPFGVRDDLARSLGIPGERIRVIVPDMGSGYGGKHTTAAPLEAARLARAAGKPVKVAWTRQEEFSWGYFRPAGVIEVKAGVKSDGTLTAWEFHNYNSGSSALDTPYDVPNVRQEGHGSASPLPQGSYRALAATANTFAREMHMDDLARAVQLDPLAFRLKNLKEARLRAVLEAAARQFGWGLRKAKPGRGFGLACGTEKGSFVAACAEVEADVKTGRLKVVRVVTAFECGAILNPDHLKNQIEGATVQGLGGALFEAIAFADGKVLNPRLSDYRVPRFADAPLLETVLLDRKDLPSAGAGETPIIAVAPAVGNAIFDASGLRLRSMPMVPKGLKSS